MANSAAYILSHWYSLIEGLQASPMEFYASVEAAIQKRQVPDARESRVDWHEGGFMTANREYLRLSRGTSTFDICGAPFGNGFFVSWWLGEPRPSPLGPTLAAIAVVFFVYFLLTSIFGFFGGLFFTLLALIVGFWILGAFVSQSSEQDWIVYLLVIPIVGPLLERFFRSQTYYRTDTALMFQSSVHAAVLEAVDELTKAKGLRALSESERKPILRDFSRR